VTCKIVCDKKIEKYHVYACKGEDFCLPGPGRKTPACCDCCAAGAEAPSEAPCGCMARFCDKHRLDFIFKPPYCQVHHRKKLVKYECQREVPVYKCVVVDLCPSCCAEVGPCGERMEAPPIEGQPPKDEKPVPPKLPSAHRGLLDIFTSR
jgi:hypothetical protein